MSADGRDLAGADRPDRLVGDREPAGTPAASPPCGSEASSCAWTVSTALPASRTSRLSPTHRITASPAARRRLGLGAHFLVALPLRLPALGVADNRQAGAGVEQHGRRDVAGVGALFARSGRPVRRSGSPGPSAPPVRSGSPAGKARHRPPEMTAAPSAIARTSARSAESPCIFQLPTTHFRRAIPCPGLLNALALAVAKARGKPSLDGRESRHLKQPFPFGSSRTCMLASFRRLSKSTVGTAIMVAVPDRHRRILRACRHPERPFRRHLRRQRRFPGEGRVGEGHRPRHDAGNGAAAVAESGRRIPKRPMRPSPATSTSCSPRSIDAKTMEAFADKFGFVLSKRLVDAQIANLPRHEGPQRAVQRAGLSALPQPAAR